MLATTEVFWQVLASPWIAVIGGLCRCRSWLAAIAYRPMFASRTATGSALALRSESFRRFLAASEGRHVDWAWQHGLVREYSAWAVALGAADAWSERGQGIATVPEPQMALSGPLLRVFGRLRVLVEPHTALVQLGRRRVAAAVASAVGARRWQLRLGSRAGPSAGDGRPERSGWPALQTTGGCVSRR